MQQQQMQQQMQKPPKVIKKKKVKKNKSIVHLISDINKSLDNYSPSKSTDKDDIEDVDDIEDKEDKENKENKDNRDNDTDDNENNINIKLIKTKKNTNYKSYLLDFTLIIIIYVLLSQNPVKIFTGKYIKFVNPNSDGTISLSGLLIYGIMIAVLFVLIKKLIN